MSFVLPIASALAKQIPTGLSMGKKANDLLTDKVGYDFLGLITKIVLIYGIAKGIEVYVQITTGASSMWISFMKLFGIQIPTNSPPFLVELVTTGFNGIKYWHIVSGLVIILLIYEWYQVKDKITPMTTGVFALLGGFLALTAIPDLIKTIKENNLLRV